MTGGAGTLANVAFSMPRDGTITSIHAFFSTVAGVIVGDGVVTVHAQLYQSTTPNNIFTPIADTLVNLTPTISGVISLGDILTGSATGLNVQVTAGTRLLMVFTSSSTGTLDLVTSVTGYADAGVAIT